MNEQRHISCGNCNGGHGCAGIDCCCQCHFDSSRNIRKYLTLAVGTIHKLWFEIEISPTIEEYDSLKANHPNAESFYLSLLEKQLAGRNDIAFITLLDENTG